MAYVDGFVLPLPKKNLAAYRRLAQKVGPLWLEYGALEYRECVGDDLDVKMGKPFPRLLRLKRGETAVFSWIVYRSRAHRDQVNAKVMKDPRMDMPVERMPFDVARMVYGGFDLLVDLGRATAPRRGSRRRARAASRNGPVAAPRGQPAAP
ncbi:MAG TPA: DUF1428 domain-containing protein [Anaeromyxobacter sp.]|nr:DUF1428 domain-containing protein [Anaeromyxobacter sp.]